MAKVHVIELNKAGYKDICNAIALTMEKICMCGKNI